MDTNMERLNGYILSLGQSALAEGAVAVETGRLEQVVLMNC